MFMVLFTEQKTKGEAVIVNCCTKLYNANYYMFPFVNLFGKKILKGTSNAPLEIYAVLLNDDQTLSKAKHILNIATRRHFKFKFIF